MNEEDVEAVQRIAAQVTEYVNRQLIELNQEMILPLYPRLAAVEEWMIAVQEYEEWREFVVKQARELKVKPSELVVKDDSEDD